jgi:hypothetical protein
VCNDVEWQSRGLGVIVVGGRVLARSKSRALDWSSRAFAYCTLADMTIAVRVLSGWLVLYTVEILFCCVEKREHREIF